MDIPLEISFHHVDPSDWARDAIAEKVEKLERIGRLVSCRVRVERPNDTHGVPPVVHIELGVPGRADLVVSYDPARLQRNFQDPDLRNAIHEAFRVAERQLLDLKELRQERKRQPAHDEASQLLGQVAEMHPDEDHGFLLTNDGGLLYFHRNSVLAGDFDRLQPGADLYYIEEMGDTGPTAAKVRVKGV